jgi:hypothetical protein
MEDPFLNKRELERITKRKKATAQERYFMRYNIPYMLDGDGYPLVLREHIYSTENRRLVDSEPDLKGAFAPLRRGE